MRSRVIWDRVLPTGWIRCQGRSGEMREHEPLWLSSWRAHLDELALGERRGGNMVTFAGKLQNQLPVLGEPASPCSSLYHGIPLRNGIRGWIGSRKSAHLERQDYWRKRWARTHSFWTLFPFPPSPWILSFAWIKVRCHILEDGNSWAALK